MLLFAHGRKWASPKGPCASGGGGRAGLAGHPAGLGRPDLQGRAEGQRGRWQGHRPACLLVQSDF